jgi:hypothetical protein
MQSSYSVHGLLRAEQVRVGDKCPRCGFNDRLVDFIDFERKIYRCLPEFNRKKADEEVKYRQYGEIAP